jgi:hypothetical protein
VREKRSVPQRTPMSSRSCSWTITPVPGACYPQTPKSLQKGVLLLSEPAPAALVMLDAALVMLDLE